MNMVTSTPTTPVSSIKNPIFKRWYFWLILGIVLIGGFLLFLTSQSNKDNDQNNQVINTNNNVEVPMSIAYDASIPDCSADLSGILNHEIFDLTDLDVVIPLGNLSPGVHTIPTDHMYINHVGSKRMAIYAPGDMTIISMDNKTTYDSATDEKIRDDYSIQFAVCKGMTVTLSHFSELEPKIQTAFDQSNQMCETQNKIYFGVADQSIYYMPCQSQFLLKLTSGELLGYIGSFVGPGKSPYATGIDLGAYNYNSDPLPLVMPSRYSMDNLHAMCGLDLFTEDLRNAYYSKLGDLVISGENVTVEPRVGEPLCGAYNQDVPGTLAGNWFSGAPVTGSVTATQYQIALANAVVNSGIGEISLQGEQELGGNVYVKFDPTHEGTINRQFSEVTPSDQIYCYESTYASALVKVESNGKTKLPDPVKYLIQLTDETHMKIEKQMGACGAGEVFSAPFTYER